MISFYIPDSDKPVHFSDKFIIVYVRVKAKLRQFNPLIVLTNFANKQNTQIRVPQEKGKPLCTYN